jgi:hypothetical protein
MRPGAAARCSGSVAVRLLISARDVAGALHLVEVARAAATDPRFEVTVVAQEPAAKHFTAAGLTVRTVAWPTVQSADSPATPELRRAARMLLDETAPDVVLTGLSTPFDAGIDEAILAEARVPTALYQDFWGEQNLILGRGADHILAIDEQAAERNLARFGRPSTVVGSARHAAYASLDVDACRRRVRAAIGAADTSRIIGFFGQALHALPGYGRTVTHFINCVRGMQGVTLLLRPHPREDAAQRRQTEAMFERAGLEAKSVAKGPVEDALAACDVVVSLFSICTFDTAYLNRFARRPVAVPMSLLFDEEIAAYCRQHGNYLDFAHHTLGLVRPVYEAAELTSALETALRPETCRDVWERAHRHLPDPARAPQRALDHMLVIAGSR